MSGPGLKHIGLHVFVDCPIQNDQSWCLMDGTIFAVYVGGGLGLPKRQ